MHRVALWALLACGLASSACTISQNVQPIDRTGIKKVCIIEDRSVRETFLPEYRKALTEIGFTSEVLPPDSPVSQCEVTSTYLAKWSWDLTIYMSYCELKVFRDGELAGQATYDSTKGSGNLGKFIDSEPKIRELVRNLYLGEGRKPAPASN